MIGTQRLEPQPQVAVASGMLVKLENRGPCYFAAVAQKCLCCQKAGTPCEFAGLEGRGATVPLALIDLHGLLLRKQAAIRAEKALRN